MKYIIHIAYGLFILFIILAIPLTIEHFFSKPKPPINTTQLDSTKVFYSKQLDSIKVENRVLQVKIEAKTETIKTLKGLVKENNHYFESITDSALFEELKNVRSGGIR